MSTTTATENEAIAEEFFERINDHDLSVVDELCADDFEVEIARLGTDESVMGREGLKAIFEEYVTAFPDIKYDVDAIVADDERVAVFTTTTGTHEGEFRGIPPTGNEIEITEGGLVRIEDGKIVDLRPQVDMFGLFEQLGARLER